MPIVIKIMFKIFPDENKLSSGVVPADVTAGEETGAALSDGAVFAAVTAVLSAAAGVV
ncbi:MAG: hypothetical protein FWC53_03600 [Firmicutes bacterium]|nr:hypothetical protein [Bacillota bacterium]